MQNNYFWGTPPDDYFCLEIWSWYHYNKKRPKFKTVFIWRSSRKMNKNKNLLILYYLWKKLSKFSSERKKVFHAFSFQLFSTANSESSFNASICEINPFKIQTSNRTVNKFAEWRSHFTGATKFYFMHYFLCGHYFIECGLIQVCIFYLFFWKTNFFCVSALFVFTACSDFEELFINVCNICIIIIYIVGVRYFHLLN